MIPSSFIAKNPEFMRQLWLELSLSRIISLPIIIGLLCLMVWYMGHDPDDFSGVRSIVLIMSALLIVWGSHLASDALLSELRGQTWHAQRMSALSAWQLVWGKLLGSTLFAWYGVILCLLIYLFAAAEPWGIRAAIILFIVLTGFLLQSVAFLFSLYSIARGILSGRNQSFPYVILVLVLLSPWLIGGFIDMNQHVKWYGMVIAKALFVNISAGVFLAWALIGLYRLMRVELQMRQGFMVWLLFELFVMVYVSGFFIDIPFLDIKERWPTGIAIALMMAIGMAYMMFFLEDTTALDIKRGLMAWRKGDSTALIQLIPCWLVSLVLAVLLLPCFLVVVQFTGYANISSFLVSVLLFAVRDVILLLWVRFRVDFKPSNMVGMVIYLACSYSILPAIFYASSMHEWAVLFFLPAPVEAYPMLQWPIVLGEIGGAYWLLQRRWQQASVTTSDVA